MVLGLLLAMGCAGNKARDEAGFRALKVAWPAVKAEVDYGVNLMEANGLPPSEVAIARQAVVEFSGAVERGDRGAILVAAWLTLQGTAEYGIRARAASGEIGPGVADSLLERLNQFGLLIRKMVTG